MDIINLIFEPEDERNIIRLLLPNACTPDRCVWLPSKMGLFSVKNFYDGKYYSDMRMQDILFWQEWWKGTIPPRQLMFGWRLGFNMLPTGVELCK